MHGRPDDFGSVGRCPRSRWETPPSQNADFFLLGVFCLFLDYGVFKNIVRVFSKYPHTLHPALGNPDVLLYLLQKSLFLPPPEKNISVADTPEATSARPLGTRSPILP